MAIQCFCNELFFQCVATAFSGWQNFYGKNFQGVAKKSAWHKKDLTSDCFCALGGQTPFLLDGWGRLGQVDWGVSVCRAYAGFHVLFSYRGGNERTTGTPPLWLHVDTKKAGLPPPDCFAVW